MAEETTPAPVAEEIVIPPTPLEILATHVASNNPKIKFEFDIKLDELALHVPADALHAVVTFLRDDTTTDFNQLMDITAVDYPTRAQRFEVVYHFLSMTKNQRLRLKVFIDEDVAVDSVADIYPTANWFEREVYDMYGIYFNNHPDLRRILTDYGFEGHPLRKDFPLTGYVELRYSQEQKRCVYEPVKLTQDFRTFDFLSPWEGMTDVQLPGDEKAVKPKFNPIEQS
jgi:NADH-quinone oxidoreductase subunit C